MATHSRILAWRIARPEEPGRLQSLESRIVGHDLAAEHPCCRKTLSPSVFFCCFPLVLQPLFHLDLFYPLTFCLGSTE